MSKHWQYLKYVLRHKFYVGLHCLEYGLFWAAITHDLSKFHPREWFPYVDRYGGNRYPERHYGDVRGALGDKYTQPWVDHRFDVAWNHHQKRNPHHWQYWVLLEDSGRVKCLEMPHRYRLEMLADWRGAGMAISGRDDTRNWYLKNRANMLLHSETRRWVEAHLNVCDLNYEGREMTTEAQEPLYPPEWGEA